MVLTFSLTLFTALLAAQNTLTKNRKFHKIFRFGFLSFTLIWIGWISSAQLSIVHILNYINAPFAGLNFGFYLMEPMIVLISLYTLLSVLIIGRGVFCGWLCPFGALQEILGSISKKLNFPKFNPKENLQKKLWLIKYFLLGIIVLLSLTGSEYSSIMQEIEPFKTAITAKFSRSWPYFLYAVIILIIGLFTERAFCRFLCPLGATLALFDRLHIVNYLKRRPECGSPCHLCERSCPVKAIQSDGKIIMDECFLCLDCMVEYNDDRRCPPLAIARKNLSKFRLVN
jgi:NosR/NirI family nitrous oxide reductase transcriptional regulator